MKTKTLTPKKPRKRITENAWALVWNFPPAHFLTDGNDRFYVYRTRKDALAGIKVALTRLPLSAHPKLVHIRQEEI